MIASTQIVLDRHARLFAALAASDERADLEAARRALVTFLAYRAAGAQYGHSQENDPKNPSK